MAALLVVAGATAPCIAQTNAAAMAVRARAEGLQSPGPEGLQPGQVAPAQVPGQPTSPEMTRGKLDTRYLSPTAAVVVVVRPAQLLASPLAQVFPVEVVSALAQKYLGFDAMEMEEIDGFLDPATFGYGVTFKFKNAIRASSIPPEQRAHAQLAELGGKKYLRSTNPMKWSLYGPNNKTLIAASEPALQQLVASATQPKAGPMADRLREVPSGSDVYLSMDVAALRPLIQKGLTQASAMIPPQAKQLIEMLDQSSGVELTLNSSAPGPTTLVVNFKDEPTAQAAEAAVLDKLQKMRVVASAEQPAGVSPVAQAMDRYQDRLMQLVQPQRNASAVTFVHLDGQNPQQQQFLNALIMAAVGEKVMPVIRQKLAVAMKPQPTDPGPGNVPVPGAGTVPPGGSPAPPGSPGTAP